MRRDLKIGMLIGVGVVICATVALSMWPGASVEERIRRNMIEGGSPSGYEPPKPIDARPGNLVIPERKPGEISEPIIRPFAGETKPKPVETGMKSEPGVTTETDKPKPAEMIHVVAQDETLSRISLRYYGTSGQWQKILQANSSILKDPTKIKPGMKLVIPNPTTGGSATDKNKAIPNR
ncbi:MAG: LysM peptidoglycan-binding domain-containing protein [Phycisphaerae bacterium]|nr:LysM peptidoglycan-binding domain-containing protein [Phycisphaerae bacterium]